MKKKRLVVKLGLLSALTAPQVITVEAAPPNSGLRPASEHHSLRQVPGSHSGIRLVQHQNQSRSLIPKLVLSQNSRSSEEERTASPNPQPGQPRRYAQQQQQRSSATTAAAVSEGESRRRRNRNDSEPGLFKRIWNRVTSSDDAESNREQVAKNQIQPGQPAPAIPRPPSLTYNGQGSKSARPATQTGSNVPSRTASFTEQKQNATTATGVGSAARKTTLSGQLDAVAAAGHQKSVDETSTEQAGGFINPFEGPVQASRDELLDLDSLVQNSTPNNSAKAVAESGNQQPEAADGINAITVSASNEVGEQDATTSDTDSGSPFNGAPVDLAAGPPQQGQPTDDAEQAKPIIQARQDNANLEPSREPSLDEPALQLPSAGTDEEKAERWVAASDSNAAITSETQAEPLIADSTVTDTETGDTEVSEPVISNSDVAAADASTRSDEMEVAATDATVGDATDAGDPALSILDDRARREQQRYRIMSRSGQSGFKGFCPVELRDHRELVDCRESYEARFGLQTYRFSSAAAKSAFEANPARYAPAAGGSDVVLLVNTGEELEGSLDFCLWYRDRLYMFKSRETQQIFSRDPQKFASQY